MRFLVTIILGVLLLVSCSSTEDKKLICYNTYLKKIVKTNLYSEVMNEAKEKLPLLKNRNNRKSFYDSTYMDSVLLDSAVFFNTKKDKCLLLILQKTSKDLNLDQIQVAQGTLSNRQWTFSFDRLPSVPNILMTVKKEANRNNSFKLLSTKGRQFILTAGTVNTSNCEIDNKYWFGIN